MPESQNSELLTYFIEFFIQDWFASIPIAFCGIVTLAVALDRAIYYSRNQRDLSAFVRQLQGDLERDNLDSATKLAKQVGGLIGLMTEEGIRLMKHHSKNFANAFDISGSLYIRDLEKRLSVLATIGAVTPFLGLFGTVVGVIVTLKLLGQQGGQSQAVVIGVAKALIATGFGLIVAIIAVVLNNWFNSMVKSFENDFQIIKLTLLDYINSQNLTGYSKNGQQQYGQAAPGGQHYPQPPDGYQQASSPQYAPQHPPQRPQTRIVPNPAGGPEPHNPPFRVQ
jgi:biopolymer transport protein ExbB